MKINFNGITREMTAEEIKAFEDEHRLLGNGDSENEISERLKKVENKISNISLEISTLKDTFLTLKETMSNLRNLTKS